MEGERGRGQEGGKGTGGGLPKALRSSSKFSLLFIFQVPAKLGMSAEAECEGLQKEPVPRSDAAPLFLFSSLTLSHPPPPSSPRAAVSSAQGSASRSRRYTQVFLWIFPFSFFLKIFFSLHTLLLRSVSQCAGRNLVFSSFIAAVLNGSKRRSLPPESSVPLIQQSKDWRVGFLWGLKRLNSFFQSVFIELRLCEQSFLKVWRLAFIVVDIFW